MVEKWETRSKKKISDCKIFSVESVHRANPQNGKESEFFLIDSPDWSNIIAITPEKNVIMVEQYRHGSDDVSLEIPGGLIDKGEDPRIAAQRELLEETGYAGDGEARIIGYNLPNPAFMKNTCYTFVWENCKKLHETKFDEHENLRVVEVPMKEIPEMIRSGTINHAIIITAFCHYFLTEYLV